MTMKRIKSGDRNTAQLIFNSFLCCFGLRSGSLVIACVNIIMSIVGIWHSLHYGNIECPQPGCPGVNIVHYFWTCVSSVSLLLNIYLLVSLIKKFLKGINVWLIWNGIILIIRFVIFVLILALNVNQQPIAGNISFHMVAFFVTIMSMFVLLSYNQQITLTTFGYYKRYRYPTRMFPLRMKDDDYFEVDDENENKFIEEEFV